MECDWKNKTIKFLEKGRMVQLQGLLDTPLHLSAISAQKTYNAAKGNDVWAFMLLDHVPPPSLTSTVDTTLPPEITKLLQSYSYVFHNPKILQPQRSYDHAIPLLPGAVPINSRPYHYSPLHKTEIENQVQQLFQAGLITHSPFASPVLLVKKRWILEILCGLQKVE